MTSSPSAEEGLQGTVERAWQTVANRSVAADKAAIQPLRQWLASQPNGHAALLSGGPQANVANDQSARELEALLIGRVARNELTCTTAAQHLSLLYRVGKRLRSAGMNVAPTWISTILRPPPSPFPKDTAVAIAKVEAWRLAMAKVLSEPTPDDAASLWALTALSTICHGALIDRGKLIRLRQMLARQTLALEGSTDREYAFIEFLMPFIGLGNHHLQRWWCDPVTELLLCRFPASGELPDFKETIPLIKNLLAGAGVEAHLLPEKMTDLLRSAEIWWATRSAPVDIHAMGRTFAAHNLTSRCWARLKGWPPRRETGAVTNPGSGTVVQEPSGAEAELLGAATAEHEWLHEVCEVLRVNDLPAAQSWVDDYLLGIAADDYRRNYFEWLASALAVPPRNPKIPTGLKALADPFVLAAPRLLNYLGLRDIRALEVGELDELYRVILDRCEPADPIERIARGLRLFHDHLVRAHKVAALPNPRATFGEGGSLMPVDATLISVDEYLAALDWLEQQLELGADPIDTAISRIVLILTFRCGLRRGEVFGLRLCDVHDMGGIYLHIRRYPTHTLKTPSATRTVRIDPLLTSRERAWLRQCCKKRGADSTAGPGDDRQQSQLLSRPSAQEDAVSIEGTVRRVMRAVHAVTNDPRLVLHHLRHSCGSWLWLKLRVPDYPEVMDLLTSMPGLCRELGQARRLRTQLCGAVAGPSRMYSYVIARILGHASPTTSLEHYVHVDDLFLAATTLRVAASTPIGVWQGLTGASRSTIYEWLARGPHGVITGSRAREARSSSADVPTEVRVQSPHPWRKKVSAPSIRFGGEGTMAKVSRALQLYNRIDETTPHEDRLAQVAHRCSVKAEQVDTWIKLARSLARAFDIKSPLTGETFIAYTPVPAPDVELHAGIVNALNNLTTKFDDTARQSPSLVGEALALVPSRFNLRRHDVVFRGPEDSIEARTLLKLLDVAGLVPQHVRLTVRRVRADDTSLPSWFRTPRAKELVVKRIPPPGTEPKQAKAYARWAGIQLCSAEGRPQGHAWRIGLFLACIAFAEIQIKHMSSTLQQGASDLPVGSSTRLYGDDHD